MIKRMIDLVCAALGLLITLPLLLCVAVLIKLDSRGPILFRQVRIGRGGKPFLIYKFRTMVEDAPRRGGAITVGDDPRITRVGRLLRRFKLDELPQLGNILKGDMSLVGPRPEVPRYVELYKKDFASILTVRPGLSDLASLKYFDEAAMLEKSESPEETYKKTILPNKIRLAKHYVENQSLLLDLAIVAQTLLSLFRVPLVVCEVPEFLPQIGKSQPGRLMRVGTRLLNWRRPLIVLLDIGLIMLSNYLAFWLRFDGDIHQAEMGFFYTLLPALVLIRGAAFWLLRLNEGLWRYTSLWDLQNILVGVVSSTVAFYGWIHWALGVHDYPRSVLIIDSVLLVGLVAGVRLPFRVFREAVIYRSKRRVLIIGSGDAGERIVREMRTQPASRYQPIGFLDDQDIPSRHRIHGVKCLGTRKDLGRILTTAQVEEVILALPSDKPAVLREIIAALGSAKVTIKTLPSVNDLLAEKSVMSQMRNLSLEDLLPRSPVNLNGDEVRKMVTGKRVLITGAGGSIGSELARQLASLRPESLVLYERHENSLYTIAKELEDRGHASYVHPVIGDVTDGVRLSSILEQHRPTILFHAAAHKHVPLVELNPAEAFKNNCIGTRIVAEMADRYGVERFVLISTDKAVNPSSVMGATKRVAELVVQDLARRSLTRFLTVRFGNVLGSNGSVIPRFQEQIQAGGPVTITHPEVRRFFMLIPEAVTLVLQAASLGEQGAIYVLEMGEQIKVLDLAKNLIRLSGYVPGEEIPIRFIGLRPGEKLDEELIGPGEAAEPSLIEKILRIKTQPVADLVAFRDKVMALETAASLNDAVWTVERLRELVPSFRREKPKVARRTRSGAEHGSRPAIRPRQA